MASRSSARIKAKNDTILSTVNIIPNVSINNGPSSPKRRKKDGHRPQVEQAVASRTVKGKRGKLKLMTEMPLDILFETFSHLQPADVLHLSQANKSLRALLFSPSAESIWKGVRSSFPICATTDLALCLSGLLKH